MRDKKGNIMTNTKEIQSIIKECLYLNELENLEKNG
jgi:hypothetical protein